MNRISEALRSAISAVHANLMRSLLTTLGIVIGVASVIIMMGIGDGARADIEKRIASLGTNVLQLRPGSSRVSGRSIGADTRPPFSERDLVELRTKVEGIDAISGSLRRGSTIVFKDANWMTNVEGVHASYLDIREWPVAAGRFFTTHEYQLAAKFAVLGVTAAKALGEPDAIVGQTIRIGDTPFEIIGLLDQKGADPSGKDQDDVVLVPLSTMRSRLIKRHKLVPDQVGTVSVKVDASYDVSAVREEIETVLRRTRGGGKDGSANFEVRDLTEFLQARAATQRTLSILLGAAATISLVVGGIGIMNIMLVSVTERTREIGLRIALGARQSDVRTQFLSEAVLLCLIGGVVGCGLGLLGTFWVANLGTWPIIIGPHVIALALGAAALTGICFGFLPAQRAARLNPIDALRTE